MEENPVPNLHSCALFFPLVRVPFEIIQRLTETKRLWKSCQLDYQLSSQAGEVYFGLDPGWRLMAGLPNHSKITQWAE